MNSAKGHASAGHTILYETLIEPPERIEGLSPIARPTATWSPTSPLRETDRRPVADTSVATRLFSSTMVHNCDVVRVMSTMMLCGSSQAVAAQS